MNRREAARLGGMSHSHEHMRELNRKSPKSGRRPFPTYDQVQADPRMRARALREIAKGGANHQHP